MSMVLIKELNAEHKVLLKALDLIKQENGLTDKVRQLLPKTAEQLKAHLAKEEAEFYPPMRKAAETNESLRSTLQVMGKEMDEIAEKTLSAFSLWMAGKGSASFVTDFASLYDILDARIKREEHSLYARYLKLVN